MSSIPSYPSLVHLPVLCTEGTVPLLRLLAVWLWPSPGVPGAYCWGHISSILPWLPEHSRVWKPSQLRYRAVGSEHWEG